MSVHGGTKHDADLAYLDHILLIPVIQGKNNIQPYLTTPLIQGLSVKENFKSSFNILALGQSSSVNIFRKKNIWHD